MMKTQNWFYPMVQGNPEQSKHVQNHLKCEQVSSHMYYQLGLVINNEGIYSLCAYKYNFCDSSTFQIFTIEAKK